MRVMLLVLTAAAALAGCGDDGPPEPQLRVETVARGLEVPWELAFLPDGSALVTERPGRVRLLTRDQVLRPRPVARLRRVDAYDEAGLLGLAVDPEFERNRLVYAYRTTETGNEVVRLRYAGGRLEEQAVVLDGIEPSPIHDGGRMRFDPDGRRLFVATGDAGFPDLARDRRSRNGKFLTITAQQARTGHDVPPEVFSIGHRNPQGFDWDPRTGELVSDEHGQRGNDEINIVRAGRDYGWPDIEGDERQNGLESPLHVYGRSIAPAGGTFVRDRGSAWHGDYVFGALVGEQLRRVRLRDGEVVADQALLHDRFGRIRTVVQGPDGALYLLTSNRDGRGTPQGGDDRILRLVPPRA